MSHRHVIPSGLAAAALVAASVLLSAPASAAPPNSYPFGTFACSNGQSYDVSVVGLSRFAPQVAFVGGKAVVAQWIQNVGSVTFTVIHDPNGNFADGFIQSFHSDFSGPANPGRRANTVDLSRLASCAITGNGAMPNYTLTADDVGYLNIDPNWVGVTVDIVQTYTETVWINPVQLSKR